MADWKAYLRWNLIANTAPALSSPFVKESFRFNSTVLRGVSEMRPRWKRCLAFTDQALGEILGQAYVRKNFTPEAKARALEMVRNIRAELKSRLSGLTWMSQETKTKAYAKLETIINKIGYPDTWRDYSRLEARPGPFVTNLLLANEFEARRDFNKIGSAHRPRRVGNDAADGQCVLQSAVQRDFLPRRDHAAAILRSQG